MKASAAIIYLSAVLIALIVCSVTVEAKAVQQASINVKANSVNGDHERYQRNIQGLFDAFTTGLKDMLTPDPSTGESKLGKAAKQVMGHMGSMFKTRK